MTVDQNIENINKSYKLGNASEHNFLGDLQQLIERIIPTIKAIKATNEQQNIGPKSESTLNLNVEIVNQIADKLGLRFVPENDSAPAPLNLPKGETLTGAGQLKRPGYATANPHAYKYVKEMRDELKHKPTEAEKLMWEELRNKKTGHKIRRQHIIENFIADFVCLRKKLVIEIDGKIHLQQKEYDAFRTSVLNTLGYEVIRFTNEEVIASPASVAAKIKTVLDQKLDTQNNNDSDKTTANSELDTEINTLTNTPPLDGQDKASTPTANSELDIEINTLSNTPPPEGQGEVTKPNMFAPIDILDYIYAVLHSPTYREKYKALLKLDFPSVPYPKDAATFWQLVGLGSQIRQLHLLESPTVEKFITQYPIDGDNMVTKPKFQDGKVYINDTQYFNNVPQVAWEFYVWGYQPAQKWLKDRSERKLEFDDILHYQKIIEALTETDRLMKEIEKIKIE